MEEKTDDMPPLKRSDSPVLGGRFRKSYCNATPRSAGPTLNDLSNKRSPCPVVDDTANRTPLTPKQLSFFKSSIDSFGPEVVDQHDAADKSQQTPAFQTKKTRITSS